MSKPRVGRSMFTPEQATAMATLLNGPMMLVDLAVKIDRTIWNARATLDTCVNKGYVSCQLIEGLKSNGAKGKLRKYTLLDTGRSKYKEYMSIPEYERDKTRSNKRMEAKIAELKEEAKSAERETGAGWAYKQPADYLYGASIDV